MLKTYFNSIQEPGNYQLFSCGMCAVGIENGKYALAHINKDDGKDDDSSKGASCIFYVSKEG